MKVLFLTVHILAVMVCFSTADLDWEKLPCDKQNERQSELTAQPLRLVPVQYVYTPNAHQPYMPGPYPRKAYMPRAYISRVAWLKPYMGSYMSFPSNIFWRMIPRNLQPVLTFPHPQYAQLPPSSTPTNSPAAPIQSTIVPITNTMTTTEEPVVSTNYMTTEDSATATIPISSASTQEA